VKTYSMDELIALTNFSARTVRHYIGLRMIAKPVLAGSATRYPRETLGKLQAIRECRQSQKITIHGIKRALRALTAEEIENWAWEVDPNEPPAPPPVTVAMVVAPPAPAVSPAPEVKPLPVEEGLELGEKWVQVPLVPGLLLMMREGAGEMTARMAREIQKKYRAG
jgi:DNA-binding transcriptional MerR regulator